MTISQKDIFNHGRHRWLGNLARDTGLPGAALRVAILLWEHMNADRGYAWPSLVYIAEQLGVDKSTVVRSLKKLEVRGWISTERRCGRHRGNRYRPAFGTMDLDLVGRRTRGGNGATKRLHGGNETVAR